VSLMDRNRGIMRENENETDVLYRISKGDDKEKIGMRFKIKETGRGYKGVYAMKSYKKGERLAVYMGKNLGKLGTTELNRNWKKIEDKWRSGEDAMALDYVMEINGAWIDGRKAWTIAKYFNDARNTGKEYNAKMLAGGVREVTPDGVDVYGATIEATKDIKVGEEIFINYGEKYWAGEAQRHKVVNKRGEKRKQNEAGTSGIQRAEVKLVRTVGRMNYREKDDETREGRKTISTSNSKGKAIVTGRGIKKIERKRYEKRKDKKGDG